VYTNKKLVSEAIYYNSKYNLSGVKRGASAIPSSKFRGRRRMKYKKKAASESEAAFFVLVKYILC
jgi:hypothetical protein